MNAFWKRIPTGLAALIAFAALIVLAGPAAARRPAIKVPVGGDIPELVIFVINNSNQYILGESYSAPNQISGYGPTTDGHRYFFVQPHSTGHVAVEFSNTALTQGREAFSLVGVDGDGLGGPDVSGGGAGTLYSDPSFSVDMSNPTNGIGGINQDFTWSDLTVTIPASGPISVFSLPSSYAVTILPELGNNNDIGQGGITLTGLNPAGQIIGYADTFYDYNFDFTSAAFLFSGGSLTPLGRFFNPDSQGSSYARAINRAGQILGDTYNADPYAQQSPNGQAALYANGRAAAIVSGAALNSFGTDGTGHNAIQGVALNSAGQVLGGADTYDAAHNRTGSTAFLSSGGAVTDLRSLITLDPGYQTSLRGVGLNDSGLILANADLGYRSEETAYVGTPGGSFLNLRSVVHPFTNGSIFDVDGGDIIHAVALNQPGEVIGQAHVYDSNGQVKNVTAFRYFYGYAIDIGDSLTQRGDYHRTLGQRVDETPVAVNDGGDALCNATLYDAMGLPSGVYSFIFNNLQFVGGVLDNLTEVSEGWDAQYGSFHFIDFWVQKDAAGHTLRNVASSAINSRGAVVGAADAYDASNTRLGSVAFVYGHGAAQTLDAFLPDWTNTRAAAINDAGQIAGYGTYQGQTQGFLLTPTVTFSLSAPASAPVGTPFSVTVTARDDNGSPATRYNGAVHFTCTDANALLPLDAPLVNGVGTFTVTLRTGGAQTITASDTTIPDFTATAAVNATTAGWHADSISVGADSWRRVLWTSAGGGAALWLLDPQGRYVSQQQYGPFPGWTAKSLSTGPDNNTRVLWTHTSGAAALWVVDPTCHYITQQQYGPYSGWTLKNISTAPDGGLRAFWTSTGGGVAIWRLDAQNRYIDQAQYGPFSGWTPRSLKIGQDGFARLLWTHTSGAAAFWRLNAANQYLDQQQYGPFPGWTATDLVGGPGGLAHAVWTQTGGGLALWTLNGAGQYVSQQQYGPYPGWYLQSLAVGPVGNCYLLWDSAGGAAAFWRTNPQGAFLDQQNFGPF